MRRAPCRLCPQLGWHIFEFKPEHRVECLRTLQALLSGSSSGLWLAAVTQTTTNMLVSYTGG